MKFKPVVKSLVDQLYKVLNGVRCVLLEQFKDNLAFFGFNYCFLHD